MLCFIYTYCILYYSILYYIKIKLRYFLTQIHLYIFENYLNFRDTVYTVHSNVLQVNRTATNSWNLYKIGIGRITVQCPLIKLFKKSLKRTTKETVNIWLQTLIHCLLGERSALKLFIHNEQPFFRFSWLPETSWQTDLKANLFHCKINETFCTLNRHFKVVFPLHKEKWKHRRTRLNKILFFKDLVFKIAI